MSLTQQLTETVRAGFTGIWIQSCEPDEALLEIARLCHDQSWRVIPWNIDLGLRLPGSENIDLSQQMGTDPLSAVRSLNTLVDHDEPQNPLLLVLENFHRFLGSAEIVQAIAQQVLLGKRTGYISGDPFSGAAVADRTGETFCLYRP